MAAPPPDGLHKALQAALNDGNIQAANQILLLIRHNAAPDTLQTVHSPNLADRGDDVLHQVHGGRVLADDQNRLLAQDEPFDTSEGSVLGSAAQDVYKRQSNLEHRMDAPVFAAVRQGLGAMHALDPNAESSDKVKNFEAMTRPWKEGNPMSTLAGQVMAAPGNPSGKYAGSIAAGALQGALQGDPEHQGVGAAVGGATAGAMPLLGRALARIGKGVVKYTPGAQQLSDTLAQYGRKAFIPLTQNSMEPGPLSTALSAMIGSRKTNPQLDSQAIKAEQQLRKFIADRSAGETVPGNSLPEMADNIVRANDRNLRKNIGDYALNIDSTKPNVGEGQLTDLQSSMFKAMKKAGMPDAKAAEMAEAIERHIGPQTSQGQFGRFAYGGNLHQAYSGLEDELAARVANKDLNEEQANMVRRTMYQPINRGLEEGGDELSRNLENYVPMAGHYRGEIQPWVEQVEKNTVNGRRGEYPLRDLMSGGASETRRTATEGFQALGDEVDRNAPPSVGDLLRGFAHGPGLGTLSVGIRPALSTRPVQELLSGQRPFQQMITSNPSVFNRALAGLRAPAVAEEVNRNASGQ